MGTYSESANLFCIVKIKSLFSSQKNFLLNLEIIERSLEKTEEWRWTQ